MKTIVTAAFAGIAALGMATTALSDTDPSEAELQAQAAACFQHNGGPQGCPSVLGWCSIREDTEARIACRSQMAARWQHVLDGEWARLRGVVEAGDFWDRAAPEITVWARLEAEQAAWEAFRAARCGWDMPVPEGIITVPEEARLRCTEEMTRARAQQLWDLSLYLTTTPVE